MLDEAAGLWAMIVQRATVVRGIATSHGLTGHVAVKQEAAQRFGARLIYVTGTQFLGLPFDQLVVVVTQSALLPPDKKQSCPRKSGQRGKKLGGVGDG